MNCQFDHEKLEVYRSIFGFRFKDRLWSIVSMPVALIKASLDYRLHDGRPE